MGKKIPRDLKTALITSWLIVSVFILLILIMPYLLPEDVLLSASSAFQLAHKEKCPLCGMTRAFICIAHGEFNRAITLNAWSIALYAIFLTNQVLAIGFSGFTVQKYLKDRNKQKKQ
jgi:hypothetical protein